jgi:CRISPR-associated endonuclease Csn1
MTSDAIHNRISFSFDIGHASIGWAAFSANERAVYPDCLGCGVALFPKEDCQNKQRAMFRRMRRHIAATRNRVARIRSLFVSRGYMTEAEAKSQEAVGSGVMMPWLLAARALGGGGRGKLTWMELWQVLRWYAHNRGYDGNERWSSAGEDKSEDTEKVQNANALMAERGTVTMAETVCAVLGVDVKADAPFMKENAPWFKGKNVAFPRAIVEAEVRRIVQAQFGHLQGCDASFLALLMGRDLTVAEKKAFRLPQRYTGGLLFGQMVPRFDNRIIPLCPISGEKTPDKHCADYYRFRWAMLVANMVVTQHDGAKRVLSAQERKELTARMQAVGRMGKKELRKAVEEITGAKADALDAQFFSPEAEKALVLDAVRDKLTGPAFSAVWPLVPEAVRRRLAGEFFKRGRLSYADILDAMRRTGADTSSVESTLRGMHAGNPTGKRVSRSNKAKPVTFEVFVGKPHETEMASGRAPYSRRLLRQAFDEVMEGLHPNALAESQPKGVANPRNGCLARTEAVIKREEAQVLDEHTNNHLVRQRILIFTRLFKALVGKYAGGDASHVGDVVIEVARDLKEFSGLNAKEKVALFSEKAKPFQQAEAKLRKALDKVGINTRISYRMIRKARIAVAQKWECPYTGRIINVGDIANDRVDFEHIIPYATRQSDALEGLSLTFREVNRMKGKRSALQFIRDCGGQKVAITGYGDTDIRTESRFREYVEGLLPGRRPGRDASDDFKINWRRKEWLLCEKYEADDAEFTKGALTATSQLNKLAAMEARKILREMRKESGGSSAGSAEHRVVHIQGRITSEFRKHWNLLGCLAPVCPEVIDESDPEKRILPKADIRNITHLHHALDAATIGLVHHVLRGQASERTVAEAILARTPKPQQRQYLESLGIFQFGPDGRFSLADLPNEVKANIIHCLGEYRVVQHMPKSMHGLRAEQTQWRVLRYDGEKDRVVLQQFTRDAQAGNVRKLKTALENPARLLGYKPTGDGKLKRNKAAVVISDNFGIALLREPVVIPFHNVWQRLKELAEKNDGKRPEVLRIGAVIDIAGGRYQGRWKIHSVKDNASGVAVDMARPHLVKAENKKSGSRINVLLKSLIKDGMRLVDEVLTGC